MVAKLIVALSCFTLCYSSPVILNGYLYRDGRAYVVGQGYTNNVGGKATGSATINGGVIQAYGTASTDDQNPLNRNVGVDEAYPGQAVAKAEIYDDPSNTFYGSADPVSQNVPTYYAVPAPATISHEQNFNNPEITYEFPVPGSLTAHSSAVVEGDSESSYTSVQSDGSGSAESSADTQGIGNYGVTSSNSKTLGNGYGSASSNIKNGYLSTVSKNNGFGSSSSQSKTGLGSLSSETRTNGGSATSSANRALESAIATSSSQGSGYASSKADLNTLNGVPVSSVKTINKQAVSWKFGTRYNVPSNVGQVYATSQSNGGSSKSSAQADNFGTIKTNADSQGHGSANAKANLNEAGYLNSNTMGNAKSAANSNGVGSINTAASSNGFGYANSEVNANGFAKSTANTQGSPYGSSNAQADIKGGSISSSANSNGFGYGQATANTGPNYGANRYNVPAIHPYFGGFKTVADAKTTGQGSASSSVRTQGVQAGYKVVKSSANSSGDGTAEANAQSL
ncbi:hypothetical protein KGM_201539 [Danaus plexippus plexippus]|uniref:Uncharacterized protein n=1 Tax=Danaus plexippus plexippus TaxID=278856 RepID=A0A212EHT0_DANPL|nr:hypothetical protein KGM_201539 [Danaus plexippus plexippus]